jgi:uncharacterized protein with gpF-like domain
MAELAKNAEERKLLKVYRSSLTKIRAKLMKIAEKGNWKLSDMQKYNRLKVLEKGLLEDIREVNLETFKIIRKVNTTVVFNTYNRNWYGYEKELNGFLKFNKLNPKLVNAMVLEPYPGIPLSSLIKNVSVTQTNQMRFILAQSLSQGLSVPQTAKLLKENAQISYNKAVRIARTEGLRASSKAQLIASEKAEQLGIETDKIWLTAKDQRVRNDHKEMEGKSADKDGVFHLPDGSSGLAPRQTGVAKQDINCRCTYVEEVIGVDRDIKDEVIPDYEEWLKTRSK